jgi:protein gp37
LENPHEHLNEDRVDAGRRWDGRRDLEAVTGCSEVSDVRLWPDRLEKPSRWRKPQRVFVNSMSDLFMDADKVPDELLEMHLQAPRHVCTGYGAPRG